MKAREEKETAAMKAQEEKKATKKAKKETNATVCRQQYQETISQWTTGNAHCGAHE